MSSTPRPRRPRSKGPRSLKRDMVTGSQTSKAEDTTSTQYVSECLLPTPRGKFRLRAYRHEGNGRSLEPVVMLAVSAAGQTVKCRSLCNGIIFLHKAISGGGYYFASRRWWGLDTPIHCYRVELQQHHQEFTNGRPLSFLYVLFVTKTVGFVPSFVRPPGQGELEDMEGVPVRVHDQCLTSEVLGSLRCDCKQQLELALDYILEHGGCVIYMQQVGNKF